MGSEETWDLAEGALTNALLESKYPYTINEGDGAFYGPKIDIQIADALGRYHQLGTIQLDFQLPERFDLHYTNMQGERVRPVVIHRALLGSLERFFGVYLEHVAGAFPFWLAPEQLVIIPVKNDLHEEHAQGLKNYYAGLGMRVRVDNRNESLGLKTRQAQTSKIPFMAVIGDKELQDGTITLRKYGEQKQNTYSLEQATQIFLELEQEKIPEKLR
jgi:threonyl-tRNA synthetase